MTEHNKLRNCASPFAMFKDRIRDMDEGEIQSLMRDLRRTQQELQTSRRKLHEIYDFAPIGHVELTREGMIVDCNFTGSAWLGRARDEIKGENFSRFLAPESRDTCSRHFSQLFSTGKPQGATMLLAEGVIVKVNSHISLPDEGRCHSTLTDVSNLLAGLPQLPPRKPG
jgi:PAS domain-containing protein